MFNHYGNHIVKISLICVVTPCTCAKQSLSARLHSNFHEFLMSLVSTQGESNYPERATIAPTKYLIVITLKVIIIKRYGSFTSQSQRVQI